MVIASGDKLTRASAQQQRDQQHLRKDADFHRSSHTTAPIWQHNALTKITGRLAAPSVKVALQSIAFQVVSGPATSVENRRSGCCEPSPLAQRLVLGFPVPSPPGGGPAPGGRDGPHAGAPNDPGRSGRRRLRIGCGCRIVPPPAGAAEACKVGVRSR
jgi:hypothetical protein